MIATHRHIATRLLPLLAGAGAAIVAAGTVLADAATSPAADPLACEIRETTTGAMIALQPVVTAGSAVSGSYSFKVTSAGGSGGSDIRQGGDFSAGPQAETTLGRVMLGNTGQAYEARLTVRADGRTVECAGRVGGAV